MIVHLFNSSSVSGPERLVLPGLKAMGRPVQIVNLVEDRIGRLRDSDPLKVFCQTLGLPYRAVPVKSRWDRAAMDQLRAVLADLHPSIVHAHAIKASIYLLEAAGRGKRTYSILSTHHGVHGLPDLKTRLYEWFYRKRYLPRFDRVLAVSTPDYDDLRRSGIDKSRLRLHLNGVHGIPLNPEQRATLGRAARAEWLPAEPDRQSLFLFGVVGRLSAEKDHDRMLKALALLNRESSVDWRCLMFGAGDREAALKAQTAALGLEKRVLWMGYRPTIGRELAGLDLLLSFSKAEGLPINIIEAGWAATPVMATLVGGIHDLIPTDAYGGRIPAAESVQATAARLRDAISAANRETLTQWGKSLQQRVITTFSEEQWVATLLSLYAELDAALGAAA